jgi:hypothetical protein
MIHFTDLGRVSGRRVWEVLVSWPVMADRVVLGSIEDMLGRHL